MERSITQGHQRLFNTGGCAGQISRMCFLPCVRMHAHWPKDSVQRTVPRRHYPEDSVLPCRAGQTDGDIEPNKYIPCRSFITHTHTHTSHLTLTGSHPIARQT